MTSGRTLVPLSDRFWDKVRSFDENGDDLPGCWEWTGFYNSQSGKPEMNTETVEIEGIPRRTCARAYRVAWVLHYGPVPEGFVVYRACENVGCVRPEHLRIRRPTEPIERPADSNRYHTRKLTAVGARRIRDAVSTSRRPSGRAEYGIYTRLAVELGISRQTVIDVVRGRTWPAA
ncbi:MAG: HNH endonuclease signature motif containing protein [Thermoplasmata archaeon]